MAIVSSPERVKSESYIQVNEMQYLQLNSIWLTSAGFHRIALAKPDFLIMGMRTSSLIAASILDRVTASMFL